MNRILITIAGFISTFFCVMPVSAHDFEYDGKFFNVVSASDHTCEVTSDSNGSKYAGSVLIYDVAIWNDDEYRVIGIADGAFSGCSELTVIETPASVEYVGSRAFVNCHKLSAVVFDDGLLRIGDYAFNGCRGLMNITLPGSLKEIGMMAFASSSLQWAHLEGEVGKIGVGVFSNCRNLETVVLNPSQLVLPVNTFSGCSNMQGIVLPDSLQSIGDGCFKGCVNLRSINIPDKVGSVGREAFYGCMRLYDVLIGSSVSEVGELAFASCEFMETIKVDARNPYLDSRNDCNAVIRTSTNELLAGCKETRCPPLVERIADKAFYQCKRLQTIKLPETVKSIGLQAFKDCLWLRRAYIDNRDCQIADGAFEGCRYLHDVDGLLYADWYLVSVDTLRKSHVIREGTRRIAPYAFNDLDILKDELSPDTKYFADYMLETISIPNSVVEIGVGAFMDCTQLRHVTLGDSITAIPDNAFYHCSQLRDINISERIESIGYSAFWQCGNLRSIYIPSRVTGNIPSAFNKCNAAESIVVHPDNPVFDSRDSCNAIILTATDELIFGGSNSTVPYGVKRIASSAFAGREGLVSIDLPETVTFIGDSAFKGCHNLLSVTMTNSVTSIGAAAFKECWNMKSIVLSDSITSIGNNTFFDCSALEYIHLPAGLRTISGSVFEYCVSLHEITLPAALEVIRDSVFNTAENLERIYIHATTPPELTDDVFSAVQYLAAKLYVPEGTLRAYKRHPVWRNFRNIIEFDATSVELKPADAGSRVVQRYDVSGRAVGADYKGLMLERMDNGDVRKVLIR